jgi:ornithine carbamoyltransferase
VKHFLSIRDLAREDLPRLFVLMSELKARTKVRDRSTPLPGRTMALIFEKPSLRTRVTFEVAMIQLGGAAVYLAAQEIGMGKRESVPDVARNLSRWVDVVAARVFSHRTLEQLAAHASIPVINGLSDLEHPCQAMADFFTLWERGMDLAKLRLAWVGDGNNVCNSLLLVGSMVGATAAVATPPGYEPDAGVLEACRAMGGRVRLTTEAHEALEDADVVYTDTWISMGQEGDREQRLEAFQRYQLNDRLLGFAPDNAVVMHCLPAHRGEEITDAVLDGPRSLILEQAENRLHAQKAIILNLLGGDQS